MSTRSVRLPKELRRAQLMQVSGEFFARKGYHDATMDDIAIAAGVSKPVLYQHFSSKLELYVALLDASTERLLANLSSAIDSTNENADRVVATMAAFFSFVSNPASNYRLIFESDLSGEPQVTKRLNRIDTTVAAHLARVIAADTGLPPDRGQLLAMSIVGMAQVSARYWLSTLGHIPLDEATALISTLAWRGIGGFPLSSTRN